MTLSSTPVELAPQLFALMEASDQGFALFDAADRLQYANPRFRCWLGLGADEHPSWVELMRLGHARRLGTNVQTEDFETWLASARSRRGKLPFRLIETDSREGRWALTAETTLPGGGMLCVLTDISDLSTEQRHLRQQRDQARRAALTDELTGLSNRRHLRESLRELAARETGLAVALLDLDHFKRVNDEHGHATGDAVLRHFALLLQDRTQRDDLSGRLGGEEFLLVMRQTDRAQAVRRVQALLHALRTCLPLPGLPQLRITASAGLVFPAPGETTGQLLARADRLLYRAKAGGRNHCMVELDGAHAVRGSAYAEL